jgi:hypothetical protein
MEGRRNVREGCGQLGLSLLCRRLHGRDHRVHVVAEARLIAAKLFLRLALSGAAPLPRVINVDGHPAYASAIAELKQSGELGRHCHCRTAPYLNNIIEQDHRFIKKRITASLGFRSAEGACRTIESYEAMHAIRIGQIRWVAKGDPVGQRQFIHSLFGLPHSPFLNQTPARPPSRACAYLQQNRQDYSMATISEQNRRADLQFRLIGAPLNRPPWALG